MAVAGLPPGHQYPAGQRMGVGEIEPGGHPKEGRPVVQLPLQVLLVSPEVAPYVPLGHKEQEEAPPVE